MSWQYHTKDFPSVYTERSFLFLIGFKKKDFLEIITNKASYYTKIKKAKKDPAQYREIYSPSIELKNLLKRINKRFLSKIKYPAFIHCGPKGRSILTAAKGHRDYGYHLSLDIEAFFDRITAETAIKSLARAGIHKSVSATIIAAAIEDDRLPQGFPTSACLSALVISTVLEDFQEKIGRNILFSIYADDILISADTKELVFQAKELIVERISKIGLKLNDKEFFAKKGEKFTWLGLNIHPWVHIPREKLIELQKAVYEYKSSGVVPMDYKPKGTENIRKQWRKSVRGKILFAKYINHNRLMDKTLKGLRNSSKIRGPK